MLPPAAGAPRRPGPAGSATWSGAPVHVPRRELHPAPDRQGTQLVVRRGRQRPGQARQPQCRRAGRRQAPQLPARPRAWPGRCTRSRRRGGHGQRGITGGMSARGRDGSARRVGCAAPRRPGQPAGRASPETTPPPRAGEGIGPGTRKDGRRSIRSTAGPSDLLRRPVQGSGEFPRVPVLRTHHTVIIPAGQLGSLIPYETLLRVGAGQIPVPWSVLLPFDAGALPRAPAGQFPA